MHSSVRHYRDELRKTIIAKRTAVNAKDEERSSLAVASRVLAHPYLKEERLIASYCSASHEIGTFKINEALSAQGHAVVLPAVDPSVKGLMNFYSLEGPEDLVPNRFGILEPPPYPERLVNPSYLEAMLIPLVAFDLRGARMGMGGGYYDRLLKKVSAACVLIGLAYDFQLIEDLKVEKWDMPLDEVITPDHHYIFSKKY